MSYRPQPRYRNPEKFDTFREDRTFGNANVRAAQAKSTSKWKWNIPGVIGFVAAAALFVGIIFMVIVLPFVAVGRVTKSIMSPKQ